MRSRYPEEARKVIWMVFRDSLTLTAIGAPIGAPFALFTGNVLASALYRLRPTDFANMAIALASIVFVAIGASSIQDRRAAGIEAIAALRSE